MLFVSRLYPARVKIELSRGLFRLKQNMDNSQSSHTNRPTTGTEDAIDREVEIEAGTEEVQEEEFTRTTKEYVTHTTDVFHHKTRDLGFEFSYTKRGRVRLIQTVGPKRWHSYLKQVPVLDTHVTPPGPNPEPNPKPNPNPKPDPKPKMLRWVLVEGWYRPACWIAQPTKEDVEEVRRVTVSKKLRTKKLVTRRKVVERKTVVKKREVVVRGGCTVIGEVSDKHSNRLIYGRTQSGKTRESCKALTARMEVDGVTGVFVTRSYTTELNEQAVNIADTINEIAPDITVVQVGGTRPEGSDVVWRSSDPSSPVWSEIIHSMKTRDDKTLYMIMGNAATITKILTSFSDGDRVRFACATDEADIYLTESQVSLVLKILLSLAISKYFISATLLDLSSLIGDDEVVEAVPSKFAFDNEVDDDDRVYRSLHSVTRYDPKNRGRSISDAIDNGKQIIAESILLGYNTEYNRKGLPYTICHFHTDENEENKEIAVGISSGSYGAYSIPVITFDQQGIKMYQGGNVADEFFRLNEALQQAKDDGMEFVYLMGGKMCSRAFRVASRDWEMYISLMIYGWGDSEAALIVQRMGRMSGLTHKDLMCAQRMYVDKKIFYKAIDCTNANTEMVKTVYANPVEQFGLVKTRVVLGKRYTKVKLSKCGVEKDFKVDENKENVHGQPKEWDATKSNPEGEIRCALEQRISSRSLTDAFDAAVNAIGNIGTGLWIRRADVVANVLEDSDDWSRARIEARLKDLATNTRFFVATASETSQDGILFKKGADGQWMLRLN